MSARPGVADVDPLAGLDLDAAAAEPGSWLELSIAADHEAVEAVSEILSRASPGGTSVEPASCGAISPSGPSSAWSPRSNRQQRRRAAV